jgi:pimeloyl-ACP methyl ester carboxylesterase
MAGTAATTLDGHVTEGRSAWLDVDWPAHQRWLELAGRRVNVVELGSGPPLLLVHGLSGCWQNWLENMPHFAQTHRVIALDLPGFGHSELPREPISIAGYARTLVALCDALDVEATTVVGSSMGGCVAAELAIAAPERVARLALVAAAGISTEHANRDAVLRIGRVLAVTAGWAVSRHERLARRPGLRKLGLRLVVRHPERLSAPLAYELMSGSGRSGFIPALEATVGYPIRDRLARVACPTLIVWGDGDRVVPVRDADVFEREIAGARKVVLPDTGHLPMLEQPDRFNALLDELLLSA